MAATEFGTNDPQTVKRWSSKLAREALGETYFKRFAGKSEDSCIQIHTDLETQPGDQIKYDVLYQDRSPGVQGDAQLEDYESELEFYPDSVKIDQLRNAHSFRRMTQQRTVHNLRTVGKDSLKKWFTRVYDTQMFAYLVGTSGNGAESGGLWQQLNGSSGIAVDGDGGFAGNALSNPDTDHWLDAGTGVDFTLGMIDTLKARAKTLDPLIRPINVDGDNKFCIVLHPYQIYQMKTAAGATAWNQIHQNASGRSDSNPIYSGALGEYNGVVIHESEYMPRLDDANSGYSRYSPPTGSAYDDMTFGVFLGAQAGSFAMGNAYDKTDQSSMGGGGYFSWVEQSRDYKNNKGIAVGSCFGIKACEFNSKRFGSIVLATDSPQP